MCHVYQNKNNTSTSYSMQEHKSGIYPITSMIKWTWKEKQGQKPTLELVTLFLPFYSTKYFTRSPLASKNFSSTLNIFPFSFLSHITKINLKSSLSFIKKLKLLFFHISYSNEFVLILLCGENWEGEDEKNSENLLLRKWGAEEINFCEYI